MKSVLILDNLAYCEDDVEKVEDHVFKLQQEATNEFLKLKMSRTKNDILFYQVSTSQY